MAKREFKSSSYDRVVSLMLASNFARPAIEKALSEVLSFRVVDVLFKRDDYAEAGNDPVKAHFLAESENKVKFSFTDDAMHAFPIDSIFTKAAESLMSSTWGVKGVCPTYNCKREKALESLVTAMKAEAQQLNPDFFNQSKKALQTQRDEIEGSEEYKAKRQDSVEKDCIDRLKKVLRKYRTEFTDEVMRRALEEVLCEKVQESLGDGGVEGFPSTPPPFLG